MDGVTVINHPLVQHKLTIMRKKETSTAKKLKTSIEEFGVSQ